MQVESKKIFMVAGETSGDHYGGGLITQLRKSSPGVIIKAMGGPSMAEAGAEIVQDFRGLDVIGFVDVLKKYFTFKRVFKKILNEIRTFKPDVLVLIDYPGFNLRIARDLQGLGIKIVYYISPKVWAWKAGRIKKLAAFCDKMLVLFDFEVAVYDDSGLETIHVGHPLVEELEPFRGARDMSRDTIGVSRDATLVGILPGSRVGEIKRIFPTMLDAAALLHVQHPEMKFVVGVAPSLDEGMLQGYVQDHHPAISFIADRSREVLSASDACIMTSGTVTLEAGLIGIPHVLCYRIPTLTYKLIRPLFKIDLFGIVNIAVGREIMPELLMGDMTPENIVFATERFLYEPAVREQAIADCQELHDRLASENALGAAAAEVLKTIGASL